MCIVHLRSMVLLCEQKACPEPDASFLNRITFQWLDSLVWTGFRRSLERSDLWDLSRDNASRSVVDSWDKNWQHSKQLAQE